MVRRAQFGSGSGANPTSASITEDQRSKGLPVHDIRAYGAVGDGTTDDSQAIIDAYEAAKDTNRILYVPATDSGYYVSPSTWPLFDVTVEDFTIMGDGWQSRIFTDEQVENYTDFILFSADFPKVRNVCFENTSGSSNNGHALHFAASSRAQVCDTVKVKGFGSSLGCFDYSSSVSFLNPAQYPVAINCYAEEGYRGFQQSSVGGFMTLINCRSKNMTLDDVTLNNAATIHNNNGMSHETLGDAFAPYVDGVLSASYTGDGTTGRSFELGPSRPRVVQIEGSDGTVYEVRDDGFSLVNGSDPSGELSITDTGIQIGDNSADADPNTDGETYQFRVVL